MKAIVNLSIDTEVWKEAKEKIDNISAFVEDKLRKELKM